MLKSILAISLISLVSAVPLTLLGPNGLINAVSAGVTGVSTGVKSTVDNIGHPTRPGTVEGSRWASGEAGANVGSAFGHAFGN